MSKNRIRIKVKITQCFSEADGSDVYKLIDDNGNKYCWYTKKITNKLSEQRIGDFFDITATCIGYTRDGYTCLKNIRIVK